MIQERPKFFGIYRGRVVDTADPAGKGRIKSVIPQVLGNNITGWIEPCFPVVLNGEHGEDGADTPITTSADGPASHTHTVTLFPHVRLPGVGQGVWIMFEAGDPDYPVWLGVAA